MSRLTIALAEEIGNPDLFTGRVAEMNAYLDWALASKNLLSKSQALLSRRKKGKTALIQRLYNVLYSHNDPQVIPFFFKILEQPISTTDLGHLFYRTFLSQYLGFIRRDTRLINGALTLQALKERFVDDAEILLDIQEMEEIAATSPALVWTHAQSAPHRLAVLKDVRVVQIIDEFQYLNRFIYHDGGLTKQVDLCHSYMGMAESKYAPLLVTGSYIGWLTTILNHMTSRFEDQELGNLTDEEALATAYNYAGTFARPITEKTASYIARVAHNDPFYISQIVRTKKPDLDLTTEEGVRAALQFETTHGKGFIAKIWMEYIAEGIARVNDVNGRKIVLYLAKHGDEEKDRDQIKRDLNLDLSDDELATRLHKLYKADLIAPGSSDFHFKGLGDPIFSVIFRKRFGVEIERLTPQQIESDYEQEMLAAKKREAWIKGLAGEYRVMCYLLLAVSRGAQPADIIFNPTPGFTLNGFSSMRKHSFYGVDGKKDEMDIFAIAKHQEDADLVVEVKTWEKPVTNEAISKFIEQKGRLEVKSNTAFLFYSEKGFSEHQERELRDHGIMYTTAEKLIG